MQVAGEIALDTSIAIRYLNGDEAVVQRVLAANVILPLTVVGELLFSAANSGRAAKNLPRYLAFIDACSVRPMRQETAIAYYQVRLNLKQKGKPIPENDIWIAAQCVDNQWTLATNDAHFGNVYGLAVEYW
jgi:tRNA(fMet)-specific endonuclease VapC